QRLLDGAVLGHDLVALHVTLTLENLRDLDLEGGRRNVHALMPRVHRVTNPREHVCDRVCHSSTPGSPRPHFALRTSNLPLPAALDDARHFTAERELAEAQTAQRELPHVRPRPAALPAAVPVADCVLRLSLVLDNLCCSRHISARFARRSSNVDVRTSCPSSV